MTQQITRALPGIEVLIVTMHESEEAIHKMLAAGAHGFLVKTNATRHLVHAVESLARHAPYFAPAATQVLLDDYLRPAQRELSVPDSPRLTEREQQVMQLLAEGSRVKDIAAKAGISVRTTETHRTNIMRKLGLHSTVDLVRYAIRNQIVEP